MMLFLTGSSVSPINSNWGNFQSSVDKSLGGFVSSSPVPNGALNKFFDSISLVTLRDKQNEILGIALVNKYEGKVATDINIKIINSVNNVANYEIAAVELSSDLLMEHIDNRYQEPIQAEFYNSDFQRANVDVTIKSIGSVGEEFILQPFNVICTINESSHEGIINSAIEGFKNNAEYSCKKLSSKSFRIERIDEQTITPFECSFITDGSLSLEFSGMFQVNLDNSKDLSDLKFNEGIGLWIKRIIDESSTFSNQQIIDNYINGVTNPQEEQVELIFSYNLVDIKNYSEEYTEEYS